MTLEQLQAAKKIAYVFPAGSSRCAFQVGVVERLSSLGIEPSMTIGVSAGVWNAAAVAAGIEHRLRFYWKSFMRMPDFDLRNLLLEHSPWRYAHLHRRNFKRFVGDRLTAPLMPCYAELMYLGDLRTREVLLGERHPETDIRAAGDAPSVRLLRLWRRVRGSAAAATVPAEPAQP